MLLRLFLVISLLTVSSVRAQQTRYYDGLSEFRHSLESNQESYQRDAQATVDAKSEEVMGELNEDILEQEEEYYQSYARMTGAVDKRTGEITSEASNSSQNGNAFAAGKNAARLHEHADLNAAADELTTVDGDTLNKMAEVNVEVTFKEIRNPYVLEYQTDEINRLLDQKFDLQEGYLPVELEQLEVDETYGFGLEEWEAKVGSVEAQQNQELNVRDSDYWHYNSDRDRLSMSTQESENLFLMADGIAAKENNVRGLLEESQVIAANGGVELFLDELGDEVYHRLLELDFKIIKILLRDSYEQDDAEYADTLVHPITGVLLKGYAKRKALKEINGGKYAHAENMRERNQNGEVLSEEEIIGLMQRLYPEYDPYEI